MARRRFGSIGRRGNSVEIRFTDPATGRRVRRTIGPATGPNRITKGEAERTLAEIEARLLAGRGLDRPISLKVFLAEWTPVYRQRLKGRSWEVTNSILKRAQRHFGTVPMTKVGIRKAEEYAAALQAEGHEPATVREHVGRLGTVWEAARERGYLASNPWRAVRKRLRKPPKTVIRVVDRKMLGRHYGATPPELRPFVILIGETGMRRGEAAALRWEDVDPDDSRITIVRSKNEDPRYLPLLPAARGVLARLRRLLDASGQKAVGLVFPDVRPNAAQMRYRRAVERAGLPITKLHHLRHLWAVRALEAGAELYDVSKALGHRRIETTMIYADHLPDRGAARAIAAMKRAGRHNDDPPTPRP